MYSQTDCPKYHSSAIISALILFCTFVANLFLTTTYLSNPLQLLSWFPIISLYLSLISESQGSLATRVEAQPSISAPILFLAFVADLFLTTTYLSKSQLSETRSTVSVLNPTLVLIANHFLTTPNSLWISALPSLSQRGSPRWSPVGKLLPSLLVPQYGTLRLSLPSLPTLKLSGIGASPVKLSHPRRLRAASWGPGCL